MRMVKVDQAELNNLRTKVAELGGLLEAAEERANRLAQDVDQTRSEREQIRAELTKERDAALRTIEKLEFSVDINRQIAEITSKQLDEAKNETALLKDQFPRLNLLINVLSQQVDLLVGEVRKANEEREKLLAQLEPTKSLAGYNG